MHHHVTDSAPESAALALKKGCDLNCGNVYCDAHVQLARASAAASMVLLKNDRNFDL